jgi:hypothetical protein
VAFTEAVAAGSMAAVGAVDSTVAAVVSIAVALADSMAVAACAAGAATEAAVVIQVAVFAADRGWVVMVDLPVLMDHVDLVHRADSALRVA